KHTEIYAYGLRNTQGLAIHPTTGDLWSNDMGPQGGDELNLIESSKNYGWPIISYGEEYTGAPIGEGLSQKEGMEQPVYYWDPSIAPSGMTFYTSKAIPEWENNLFIGALRSSHIIRLMIKDNKVIGEERLLQDKGQRFRDIAMGLNGELYAITDSGILYRIGK
ncbi:MAG: PQQ-dependent sugar dehydrogenase, partial [Erysipelotrichaceae bacterium]|nr:PQQ-dependent sugar dehydrogenase [Erysipelotrichaceae bacterium]